MWNLRRPPSRDYVLGFGDFRFPVSGKHATRRTRYGIPSKDFLEDFLQRMGAKAQEEKTAAPAGETETEQAPVETQEAASQEKKPDYGMLHGGLEDVHVSPEMSKAGAVETEATAAGLTPELITRLRESGMPGLRRARRRMSFRG